MQSYGYNLRDDYASYIECLLAIIQVPTSLLSRTLL